MRKIMALFIMVLGWTGLASAQGTAIERPTPTVVTLGFNAAVLQTSEAQRDLGALQVKFAPRQTQLQTLNNEIESLRRELGNTVTPLNDSERTAKEQAINSKIRQLQRQAEDFKGESETASQEAFQRVALKMYTFVQEYAQQHAYALILERGSDANPVVWYAANNIDITDQVVKAYNVRSGSSLPDTPRKSPSPQHSNPAIVPPAKVGPR